MYPGDPDGSALRRELSRQARDLFPDVRRDRAFPRLGDGVVRQLDMVAAYASLTAVACDRAEYYGELLDTQIGIAREHAQAIVDGAVDSDDEDERRRAILRLGGPPGLEGLIGYTYTAAVVGTGRDEQELQRVETAESIRALVALEAEERDRAAKLLHQGIRIGVQVKQVEAMRAYGDTIALAMQAFAAQLGIDTDDELVSRAAARAVILARLAQGAVEGDPDVDGGPELSAAERRGLLVRALPAGGEGP